jgi:hypothetical protein
VWTHPHIQVWVVYAHVGEMEGDLDNLAKPILDALNGPLWTDDRQIAHLTLRRVRRDSEAWPAQGDLPGSIAEVLRLTEDNEEFVFVRAVPYVADTRLP